MNWEAFFAIGAFTVILGAMLLVPGLLWARKMAKQHPETPAGMSITKNGYIFIGVILVVLFTGLTSQYWAPDSPLGQWTATRSGRYLFGGIVPGVALLIERVLSVFVVELRILVRRK